MKKYKRILTVLISVLIMIQSIMFNTQVVYAKEHESGDNVVYKESALFVDLNFPFVPNVGQYKYYVDDAAGIPTGGGYYFWKYGENDKFAAVPQSKIFAYVLNNGIGLTVSDTRLAELVQAYYGTFVNLESGFLFDGQGNKLGICLNDITGCVYENAPQNTDITIPSTETNNIYNFYQYYINTVSPETPDYIGVQTYNINTALQSILVSNAYRDSYTSIVGAISGGLSTGLLFSTASSGNSLLYPWNGYGGLANVDNSNCSYYAYSASSYDAFCNGYGLKNNGDKVGYTDLITSTDNNNLTVYLYNNSTGQYVTSAVQYSAQRNASTYTTSNINLSAGLILCRKQYIPLTSDSQLLTVYKNANVFTSIQNNTYAPSTFSSSTYNNFNSSNTQNMTTNTSVVNNSETTNNEIYNDASQSFTDYYSSQDNYNIDNSVVIENTTEIIYNYYGTDNGGGEGGGGEGGGGSDDDDFIWDAMLKAIVDFFKKIGELIAALITGILGLFTQVLDALTAITTNFTSLTNFFTSILGFLPSEMIAVLTAALSLILICCIIRIFRR